MRMVLTAALVLVTAAPLNARPLDEAGRLDHVVQAGLPEAALSALTPLTRVASVSDTVYFGGTWWNPDSTRWEAIEDSCWTFDSGVGSHFDHGAPHVNPYKDPSLHAYMEGWVGWDASFSDLPYFRRKAQAEFAGGDTCVGASVGLQGEYSFWAGVLPAEAELLCYADGQGYGSSWNICIGHTETYNGVGNVSWSFDYVLESEPGFDYAYAFVDTSGSGNRVELWRDTGIFPGTFSMNLVPGSTMRSTPGPLTFLICARSDGAYDDQDALFATTCGLLAVDSIAITGGGIAHTADFESGDDGWSRQVAPNSGAGGDWSRIQDLSSLPPSHAPCNCAIGDSVLLFERLTGGHSIYSENLAVSPWIDLKKAGRVGSPTKFLEFGGYFDLPLLNYLFVHTQMQWYPTLCPITGKLRTSGFKSDGFVRYFGGVPSCGAGNGLTRIDFSGVVDYGAEQMRVAVGVVSYCRFFAGCSYVSNSTPWFDNVKLGVAGTPGAPRLTVKDVHLPQDSFPESGYLAVNATARLDCNTVKGFSQPEPYSSLGDTLVVSGATGGAEVWVNFAVHPGPGVDAGALAAWLASVTPANLRNGVQWYTAQMDTAEQGGVVKAGEWMTTRIEGSPGFTGTDTGLDPQDLSPQGTRRLLNDIFPDNLFTPGTRVELFYRTRFEGSSLWQTLPDTLLGAAPYEWECLPSSMTASGEWNCLLYVDHATPDAQPVIEAGLLSVLGSGGANFEGVPWDRWDVTAPSSQQLSFGRPPNTEYGATLSQVLGYNVVVWNSGPYYADVLSEDDANVLIPWLSSDFGPTRGFYASGDGFATATFHSNETRTVEFIVQVLGVAQVCNSVAKTNCPSGTGADTTSCFPLDPTLLAWVAESTPRTSTHGAQTSCPVRTFDVLGIQSGPGRTSMGDEDYVKLGATERYASIATERTNGTPHRMVVDGLSLHHRRHLASCQSAGTGAVAERLAEVLGWFGLAPGAVCMEILLDIPEPPTPAPVTALLQASPNPVRLGATEIRFTLSTEMPAEVSVHDLRGRLVRRVWSGVGTSGMNRVTWDGLDGSGRQASSGVYFYRLRASGREYAGKLLVLR